MPKNKMLIFTGDKPPIDAQKFNFWERSELAGLYFPNPYHPPLDRVKVKTWHGVRDCFVETARVPDGLRDYPQYQGRAFRFIRGYCPKS